jgi:hypothetical protein
LIISNIIAGKLWATPILNVTLTAGVFLFPVVYIIGDVIPEVYGIKAAKKVILLGFLTNVIAVGFFLLTIALPYPPYFTIQDSFKNVLGFTPRLLIASFVGYLAGTNVNAYVLIWIKKLTKEKYLWIRTISSTIFGESVDSILFITIAFTGILPKQAMIPMIIAQAGFKILYEVLATPLTYAVVSWVKQKEKYTDVDKPQRED